MTVSPFLHSEVFLCFSSNTLAKNNERINGIIKEKDSMFILKLIMYLSCNINIAYMLFYFPLETENPFVYSLILMLAPNPSLSIIIQKVCRVFSVSNGL